MNEVYWRENIKFGTSEVSLRDQVLISEEHAISLHSKKRQNARKNYHVMVPTFIKVFYLSCKSTLKLFGCLLLTLCN